jgi:recombinational DNA repair ATPase RecF
VALASISLRGFRNLELTSVDFAEGSNYLFGPNGAGKTNLLEAIHYLAIGRSFRRCPDAEMLGFGKDVLAVSGTDESGDTAEIRFDGREKRILRNAIPVEKLSEYFGWLPVVVLLLEDIELVRGAPGIRRNFLDVAIAKAEGGVGNQPKSEARWQTLDVRSGGEEQKGKSEGKSQEPKAKTEDGAESYHKDTKTLTDGQPKAEAKSQEPKAKSEGRSYIALIAEYRRAVSQYNRLLEKGGERREQGGDELAAWEEELVRAGVPVYEARLAKVGELLENAAKHYERLAGHGAVFSYRSSIGGTGHDPKSQGGFGSCPLELASAFRQRLAQTRERARALGHAVVGPHRDDIRITRGDRELRKFGSVGEQRLAGIALRLAEADMILSAGRQRPVFLLDEVASELDEQRSRMVLEMVAERGQMVYAAARRIARLEVKGQDAKVKMQNGGQDETLAARDAESLDHLTTGPLDHFSGKEFHVEAGTVSEVS